jgi:Amt family ammonium transporter
MNEQTNRMLDSVQLRVALPALLTVVLFVASMSVFFIPALEGMLLERKQEVSRRLVEAAYNIIATYAEQESQGMLSRELAQQGALHRIRTLRYGDEGKDYFWVNDMRPVMLMHPYRSDLEGKYLGDFKDPTGRLLFKDIVEVVRRDGGGMVDYYWQWYDESGGAVHKSSYVKGFEPWGWVVGTGMYTDDVAAEIDEAARRIWIIAGGVSLVALLLAGVIIIQARNTARERKRIWTERENLLEELSGQREQYRSLVDNLSVGVAQVDRRLRITAVNRRLSEWFPAIDPVAGTHCHASDAVGCDVDENADCPARAALSTGKTTEGVRERFIHGGRRSLRVVASPVFGAGSEEVVSVILTIEDITGRLANEAALREAEARYRGIVENAIEGIYQTTPWGRILSCNPSLARVFGYETPEAFMEAANRVDLQIYADPGRRAEFVALMERDGEVAEFESEALTRSGETIWISENTRTVRDESGAVVRFDGTMLDVTKRKRTELELERQRAFFQELFESSPLGIVQVDTDGIVLKANNSFESMFGFKADEVVGKRNRQVLVPDNLRTEAEAFLRAVNSGKAFSKETMRKRLDGMLLPVNVVGYPIRVEGAVAGAYYIYQDITERKDFERQLSHQAFHDALTSLPNRSLYMERLGRAVQRAKRREDYHFSAMMIDLDRFKRVNDTLGHQAGDQLLVGVALRILSCIRTVDTVARLGGDEFAILLEEFENTREVIQVANRIHEALREPFLIDGQEVLTGASVGIVLHTRDYKHPDEILRDADIAMYQAKERGRSRLVFNKRMHDAAMRIGRMEVELRSALANNELILHYQPIVNVQSGDLQGFEALVRWNHPSRGMLGPMEFIPLAEETGLIIPLGRWVLREACERMARWCHNNENTCAPGISMSVNISARQFAQPDLVEYIQGVLGSTGLDPSKLKLEITESVLMEDAKQTAAKLRRLKATGIQLMVDDFGTGYSSLAYLQQFPVDFLKIDKSFISGEGDQRENREIVNTIIMLARNLGLKVVAEGVEQEHQLDMLREMRCDDAQGFMFSRPVDQDHATDILATFMAAFRGRTLEAQAPEASPEASPKTSPEGPEFGPETE